jgi:hypothetical protein
MSRVARRVFGAAVLSMGVVLAGLAQGPPGNGSGPRTDPRVGLKAGLRDAGQAAWNLELGASLPKPGGFFDPGAPAGAPTPPEVREGEDEDAADAKLPEAEAARRRASRSAQLAFANSDLAFRGEHLFVGSFHGFNTYDIEDPTRASLVASIVCPGGQGDVSVHGNLLIMSVEQTRGRLDCGTHGVAQTVSRERFRGIRIFDISDVRKPRQIAAVQTCRGSHTHTLVSDPDDSDNLYVYASGTSTVRPAEELAGCSGKDPKDDPDTALFSIDVIQIPLASPEKARIVNRPRIFADPGTGSIAGLWPGGTHGPGTQKTSTTNQCHDITVYPEAGLAAGACSGNGILLDISDPVNPVRLDAVVDKNFAYWHSATFNNDGTKVIFTDEWGGGTRPRCRPTDSPAWGANAIFDIVDRKLRFGGYYKLPVPQTEVENCVAHNGSIVPVPGRDIMVQGWYQGGISVFDFTDSARPFEIAFFDRGPLDAKQLITGGYWSAYWYNGHIYGAEIARGLDVFRLKPSALLSASEIEAASLVRMPFFNAQQQPRITWPATTVVARAYLDQLARGNVLGQARLRAIQDALERADRAGAAGRERETLAAALEGDAASAAPADAVRMRAIASILRAPAK